MLAVAGASWPWVIASLICIVVPTYTQSSSNISRIEPPFITSKEASTFVVWVTANTSATDSCTYVKIGNVVDGLVCSRMDANSFSVSVSPDIHSYALDCGVLSSQIGGWSTYASLEIHAGQFVFATSQANRLEVRFPQLLKASPSSWQLFTLSLSAVMKIMMCASGGAFLAHLELLDSATASKIGKITTTMLLPALLFCSLSESITVEAISRLWFLPASCVFIVLFGTAAGFFCGWVMRLDPTIRSVSAGCAGFGNAQGFPLVLMATIAEKLYDAEKQLLGLAYLSMYLIAHSSLLWGLAPIVVRPSRASLPSPLKQSSIPDSGEADNVPMVQIGDSEAAPHPLEHSLTTSQRDHHEGAMGTSDGGHDYLASERIRAAMRRASALAESGAHDIKVLLLKYFNIVAGAIPPPVRGVLLGIFVGSVPFLRAWFVAKDGWANFAWKAAAMLGSAAVPFSTMMMGVNVYYSLKVLFKVGFKASGLTAMTRPILAGIVVRFLLLPVFGRLLLAGGIAVGAMPSTRDDPIFSLMILLQSFTPSANNIILVVDAGDVSLCQRVFVICTPSCDVNAFSFRMSQQGRITRCCSKEHYHLLPIESIHHGPCCHIYSHRYFVKFRSKCIT
jgi:predicted permease